MLQMQKYGSATNFHGGPGEEHHNVNIKNLVQTHNNVLLRTRAKFLREMESQTSYPTFIDLWKIPAFHWKKRPDGNYGVGGSTTIFNTDDCLTMGEVDIFVPHLINGGRNSGGGKSGGMDIKYSYMRKDSRRKNWKSNQMRD